MAYAWTTKQIFQALWSVSDVVASKFKKKILDPADEQLLMLVTLNSVNCGKSFQILIREWTKKDMILIDCWIAHYGSELLIFYT